MIDTTVRETGDYCRSAIDALQHSANGGCVVRPASPGVVGATGGAGGWLWESWGEFLAGLLGMAALMGVTVLVVLLAGVVLRRWCAGGRVERFLRWLDLW